MNGTGDFESELERELHRILDPIAAAPIPLRRAPLSGGIMKRLLGGAGAALGAKLLTGIAVAAAAVVVAGAATEVAVTGSLNPTNWGQQVKTQVGACKASAARLGVHGIGECVSDFASSKARENQGKHKGNDNGTNNGKGNAKDKDKGKSTGTGNGNSNSHKPTNPGAGSESSLLIVW
ncbi:MAG TPA: hypothetical protein VGA41_10120 [Candidatus Dormibacteraeota bacterium]